MVQRIIRNNYRNFFQMALGVVSFWLSFKVGESSVIGMIMHLGGCALFCSGVHGIHDVKMEGEVHPHAHH